MAKTKIVKRAPRRRKYVKKNSIAKLAKQVRMIKREFKPELKEVVYSNGSTAVTIAQLLVNGAGYYASDVTPVVSQGSGVANRIGSSYRLKNIRLQYQLSGQSSQGAVPTDIKWFLVRVKGQPVTAATFTSQMFETNPFIFTSGGVNAGIIDYNSQIAQDYKPNYQILKSKRDHISMEYYASGVPCINRVMNVSFKKPHLVQFDLNTNNVVSGQLILIGLASAGNMSTTTASTNTGVPTQAQNTGLVFHTNMRFQYYDD